MSVLGLIVLLVFILFVVPKDIVTHKLAQRRTRRALPVSMSHLIHVVFFFLD